MLWRGRYLAIFAAAWLLGLCWAVSSPLGSSPDDNYHLTTIYCETGDESLCRDIDGEGPGVTVDLPSDLTISGCYAFTPQTSGACTLTAPGSRTTNDHYNRGEYPPTFYAAMSLFAGDNVADSVLVMRIFALTVALAVMALSIAVAPGVRVAQVVAWAVGSIPLAMFLFPSTNPSSWAIAGLIAMWPAGYALVHAEGTKQTALAAAAVVAAAVLATSRGDTAAITGGLLGLIALVYVRSRRQWLAGSLAIVLALGLMAVFLSAGQTIALDEGLTGSESSTGIPLLWRNLTALPELWVGSFGIGWGLGWLDTKMPGVVWAPTIAVVGALMLMGLVRIRLQRGLMLLAMAAVAVAYPIVILQLSGAPIGTQFQPRYVLPVLLVLFGLALSPLDGNRVALSAPQRALVTVALVAASSVALHTQLRRYATGTDALGPNLNAGVEWSYGFLSPMAIWVIGTLAGAVLFGITVWLLKPVPRESPNESAASG